MEMNDLKLSGRSKAEQHQWKDDSSVNCQLSDSGVS